MARTGIIIGVVAAVTLAAGGGLYHFVFSPHRTKVVEGYRGPANSIGISPRALSETALVGEVPGQGLDERVFRTRFWQVNPGGVVPIHTHTGRPAIVYVLSGVVQEFRNGSETPETYHEDESSAEGLGVVHYWRNESDAVVHLWANDVYVSGGASAAPRETHPAAPEVEASGVSIETMEEIEFAGEDIGVERGSLRLRRIEIAPGGQTAINAAGSTPFSAYVTSGDVVLHRAGEAEPVNQTDGADAHVRTGDWAWWENASDEPATLIVSDIAGFDAQ